MEPQTCDACGKAKHTDKDLLKCGRCKQVFYHDKECQRKHWSKHKAACKRHLQKVQEEREQEENLQVLDTEDKGRVVVAKKSFAAGETVLLESPAVLFDTRLEYLGLLQAFSKATGETQTKVLDLCAPPLDQIDSAARQQRHARLEQQRQAFLSQHPEHGNLLTIPVTQKLLAIIETNAHQLFNANLLQGSGSNNNNNVDPKQWMGLFVLGSMLEHSCNPNATMNTTRDGKLELIAETTIQEKERISFSYIEGIYEKSRAQRQAVLLEEKHFQCNCARCRDLDECRPIPLPCEFCSSTHPIFWHADRQAYVCVRTNQPLELQQDDARIMAFQKKEAELVQSIRALEQQLETGTPFQTVLQKLAALMTSEDWKANIHPLHWLNVSACQFLSTTAAAMARLQNETVIYNPPNASLLRLSVLALLQNITWVEQLVSVLRQSDLTKHTSAALQELLAEETNVNNRSSFLQVTKTLQTALTNHSNTFAVPAEDMKEVLHNICSQPATHQHVTADALLTAFYAGQDMILAGHADLCLLLYQRYQSWFHKLKQPNEDNRARIDAFVSSQGRTNPFANVMM